MIGLHTRRSHKKWMKNHLHLAVLVDMQIFTSLFECDFVWSTVVYLINFMLFFMLIVSRPTFLHYGDGQIKGFAMMNI